MKCTVLEKREASKQSLKRKEKARPWSTAISRSTSQLISHRSRSEYGAYHQRDYAPKNSMLGAERARWNQLAVTVSPHWESVYAMPQNLLKKSSHKSCT